MKKPTSRVLPEQSTRASLEAGFLSLNFNVPLESVLANWAPSCFHSGLPLIIFLQIISNFTPSRGSL